MKQHPSIHQKMVIFTIFKQYCIHPLLRPTASHSSSLRICPLFTFNPSQKRVFTVLMHITCLIKPPRNANRNPKIIQPQHPFPFCPNPASFLHPNPALFCTFMIAPPSSLFQQYFCQLLYNQSNYMSTFLRQEILSSDKPVTVVKVTVESMKAMMRGRQVKDLRPARLVTNDAGERIVRTESHMVQC